MIHFRICESFSIFFNFPISIRVNPHLPLPFSFRLVFNIHFSLFFYQIQLASCGFLKTEINYPHCLKQHLLSHKKKKRARYHHIILEWKKFIASLFLVAIHDSNKNWFTNWFTTQKGQKPLTVGDKIFCPFDGVSLINYS